MRYQKASYFCQSIPSPTKGDSLLLLDIIGHRADTIKDPRASILSANNIQFPKSTPSLEINLNACLVQSKCDEGNMNLYNVLKVVVSCL